ncbi:MAG: helix-turn-helix transcriptional regulator [Prevotella sp.]|jgi:DNA-binding HxlR family transcriptional regulator|nr:helix-turn-helix transcriptional regulator [Prevotella sp.]
MQSFLPNGNCPVRNILSKLADKWSMLVLITLHSNGVMRFGDIHKTIGDVSHRMLTVTLKSLEADGLVTRKVYAEIPPRVEYDLTETGTSLIPHIQELVQWASDHLDEITKSRSKKVNV